MYQGEAKLVQEKKKIERSMKREFQTSIATEQLILYYRKAAA
jgi:hypothetical protein